MASEQSPLFCIRDTLMRKVRNPFFETVNIAVFREFRI